VGKKGVFGKDVIATMIAVGGVGQKKEK